MIFFARFGLAAVALAAVSSSALAHHPMGGMTPTTFTHGLLSGFGHPIIGLDHLAALVAVGLIAARLGMRFSVPAAFVIAMLVGVGVHLGKIDIPAIEPAVSLSVLALGLVLVFTSSVPRGLAMAFIACVGLLHGYALGESIIGAETTPLFAYFLGLATVQTAIMTGLATVAAWIAADSERVNLAQLRFGGYAIGLFGLALFALNVIPKA
jgi:urease accessory protein